MVDANVFIEFERRGLPIDLSRWQPSADVFISVMTVSELLMGVHRADSEDRRQRRSAFVEAILAGVSVLDFTVAVARCHARLHAELARQGHLIGAHDMIVAATAVHHGLSLLTDNTDEFSRVPGLNVIGFGASGQERGHIGPRALETWPLRNRPFCRSTAAPTRPVKVGSVTIGGGHPIVVQSMCATKTADVEATAAQVEQLAAAGAGVVRIAVDTQQDCEALAEIRRRTTANLSVDLQENYRLGGRWSPRWSTRFATTRATCIITSGTALGRTRSASWSTWPASTTVRCGWA